MQRRALGTVFYRTGRNCLASAPFEGVGVEGGNSSKHASYELRQLRTAGSKSGRMQPTSETKLS